MKEYIQTQEEAIQLIENHGGKITWKKDFGRWAKISYRIYKNEPKLNIEALLLGHKFGVIIHPLNQPIKKVYLSKNHKIFNVNSLEKFKTEFKTYLAEELLKNKEDIDD